jgi:hypothetical protein
MPPSQEAYAQRVRAWLTESDAEIAARRAAAAAELELARGCGAFDAFVVNDEFESGYAALKASISKFRPDVIPPPKEKTTNPAGGLAAAAALAAAAGQGGGKRRPQPAPPLLLCGPAGGGREALASQLLARLPGVFSVPPRVTDRKAAAAPQTGAAAASKGGHNRSDGGDGRGGAKGGLPEPEVMKPEAFAKLAAAGQLVLQWVDAAGAQVAVTLDALKATAAAGERIQIHPAQPGKNHVRKQAFGFTLNFTIIDQRRQGGYTRGYLDGASSQRAAAVWGSRRPLGRRRCSATSSCACRPLCVHLLSLRIPPGTVPAGGTGGAGRRRRDRGRGGSPGSRRAGGGGQGCGPRHFSGVSGFGGRGRGSRPAADRPVARLPPGAATDGPRRAGGALWVREALRAGQAGAGGAAGGGGGRAGDDDKGEATRPERR